MATSLLGQNYGRRVKTGGFTIDPDRRREPLPMLDEGGSRCSLTGKQMRTEASHHGDQARLLDMTPFAGLGQP